MTIDLSGALVFVAVAETHSFRKAAERLGVTRSAVSQAVQRLEDRLGVALVQRTTRSVTLTEAGAEFYRRIAPPISAVGDAMDAMGDRRTQPSGTIRLAVSSIAERFISGPILSSFVERYPDIALDVMVTDEEFDIVAHAYDAGVRLKEAIEQDMIAVPVSDDQRQVVVAAPSYLRRFGAPDHPRGLIAHRCIGWRPSADVVPYRWEFEEAGQPFSVDVGPRVCTNDMWLMIRTACAGGGFTFGMEETFRPYLERTELVTVLEAYCPRIPGFFLFFPARRNLPPKMRALIDHVRRQQ